ncbi:hypothetical protein [Aeromonas rivipollensis]|uniref:hypothetical protein n=1 Tax=Aeromonas rivipollensis TaxID=948519 RepID=UPI001331869D|nr:hypothetical protein [Aeromonas rivipollensis]
MTVTAVTDADGNYNTSADLSGLADGNLTVEASVTDAAGNRASATDDTSLLDTTAHITVSLDDVNAPMWPTRPSAAPPMSVPTAP